MQEPLTSERYPLGYNANGYFGIVSKLTIPRVDMIEVIEVEPKYNNCSI